MHISIKNKYTQTYVSLKERERMKKKMVSGLLSLAMLSSAFAGMQFNSVSAQSWEVNTTGKPQYQETARQMEELNRGLIATYRTADGRSVTADDDGVYLSWRLLGDESLENQAFDIYKNGKLLATTGAHDATNYIDPSGTKSDRYKVVKAGADATTVETEPEVTPGTNFTARGNEVGNGNSEKNSFTYMDVPISRPDPVKRMGDGKTSYYYTTSDNSEGGANDASVGDLDGDGDYEIVLKWNPNDAKDSAGSDFTGRVYIDAYEITTSSDNLKWRIDLGQNVTAGAHYTQFIVFDFDGDGRSEVAMQTAPGSIDGQGNYVSEVGDTEEIRNVDNTKSYVGTSGRSKGKNLGPEYYTVFDGETGAALTTTAAIPLGNVGDWGDSKYNRSERFLAGVAYLDGIHPSYIACRGYYNKAVIRAYTFDGSNLNMTWESVGSSKGSDSMYGQGNHNLSIADIDNDGFDEIVYGSAAMDQDGKVLGNTLLGHGDALHVNDFNNDGWQEAFSVKEEKTGYAQNAANFRVAGTGQILWGKGASGDTGRGVMDNIDDNYAASHPNALALAWSSSHENAFDLQGNEIAAKPNAGSRGMTNFLVFWDGDLGRELLDDNIIAKYYADTGTTKRFYGPSDGYSLTGGSSNNGTKATPALVADIWGDWREEVVMRTGTGQNDTPYLRIYTSTIPTEYRLTTLMHDSQYRCSVAWQNVGYNQPTHQSYYIGTAALAEENGEKMNYLAPATVYTKVGYDIDRVNVTGVTLSEDSLKVEKGHSESVSAKIEPADATIKAVMWTSSDPDVATVFGGTITGVNNGTATITAKTRDGNLTASCEVTVWSTPVTGVKIPDERLDVGLNCSKPIVTEIEPENASVQDVTWTTSNPAIATVDAHGVVYGKATGAVLVTATTVEGGYTASCVVNVVPLEKTDATGSESFVTSNTDPETVLSNASPSSATLTQTDAMTGGDFYRKFETYDDNKVSLSFKFVTGGMSGIGTGVTEKDKWNWTGHEYTFGLQFMDSDGNNIMTLSQPYTDKGGSTVCKIGNLDTFPIESDWTNTVEGSISDIQGSTKRWFVEIEFDYDNNSAVAKLSGCDSSWNTVVQYTREFELNGAPFEELKYYTTKDGEGGIYVNPQLSDLKYTRIIPAEGASKTLYEKGTAWYNAWESSDLSDWAQEGTGTAQLALDSSVENGRVYYEPYKPGSAFSATKEFDISDASVVTYNVDWYFGNSVNRYMNAEYIQFGDNLRFGWTLGRGLYISTDAGVTYPMAVSEDGKTVTDSSQGIFFGDNEVFTKNIQVVFNVAEGTIERLVFDGTEISKYSGYKLPDGDKMNSVSFGFQRAGATDEWTYPVGLDSIFVSEFVEGAEVETPTPAPTITPATPTPELIPIEHDVEEFTAEDRITVSEAEGEENEITFTNSANANNGHAAAYADISSYVSGEDYYEVDFDSYVTSSSRARIALCDTSVRPGNSNKSQYDTTGIAYVQGVVDSSSYAANENKAIGNAPGARDAYVHTNVKVNAKDKTLSYTVKDAMNNVLLSGEDISYLDSGMESINGIEFFDIINSSVAKIKNVKVTTFIEEGEATPAPTDEATPTPTAGSASDPTEPPTQVPEYDITVDNAVIDGDKVKLDVTNNTEDPANAIMIVASYNDGVLCGLSVSTDSVIEAGGTLTLEADAPQSETYKVMLWDGLGSMNKLMTKLTEEDIQE